MALRGLCHLVRLPPSAAVSSSRMISGKLHREHFEKPKPFPQDEKDYKFYHEFFYPTTTSFDSNSKVIVIDGAHAVGKTKLAEELAEEFGMKLFGHPNIGNLYINSYGVDLRQYAEHMVPINKPYDEKDFARDPTGPVEGSGDRYLWFLRREKLRNYMYAIKHLFNTGQGVIVEGSPFSDYAHFDAACNQGWISRTTRVVYNKAQDLALRRILRPNVIIYLDAPVDRVISNIKARGNEWDKNSPVWTNERYLTDIYMEMKRNFLKKQQNYTYVLVYDWSEPGDVDVIVEDVEELELDYVDEYSDMQKDWKAIRTEELHRQHRFFYCNQSQRCYFIQAVEDTPEIYDAEQLWLTAQDIDNYNGVLQWEESERWAPGYNARMGDKGLLWAIPTHFKQHEMENRVYAPRYGRRSYD